MLADLGELAALVQQVDDAEIGKAVRNLLLLPDASAGHDLVGLLTGWLAVTVQSQPQRRKDDSSLTSTEPQFIVHTAGNAEFPAAAYGPFNRDDADTFACRAREEFEWAGMADCPVTVLPIQAAREF